MTAAKARAPGDRPNSNQWAYVAAFVLMMATIVGLGAWAPAPVAWILSFLILLGFVILLGFGVTGHALGALIDDRNKMSLSRLQMILWTGLILSALLTAVLVNLRSDRAAPMDIAIPGTLWALMGISTTALVGSPLIRSTKRSHRMEGDDESVLLREIALKQGSEPGEVKARGVEVVNQNMEGARWSDLVRGEETSNGAHLDLGKVQNLYFTLIVALSYASSLLGAFSKEAAIGAFPALSEGMVALIGISHAGYLAFKATPHTAATAPAPSALPTAEGAAGRRAQADEEHPSTEPA